MGYHMQSFLIYASFYLILSSDVVPGLCDDILSSFMIQAGKLKLFIATI